MDFAYCNGWYSDEVIRVLAAHGFRSAVTTEDLPNRIGGDPFTLKRKVLWENFSIGMLGDYSTTLTGVPARRLLRRAGREPPGAGQAPARVARRWPPSGLRIGGEPRRRGEAT